VIVLPDADDPESRQVHVEAEGAGALRMFRIVDRDGNAVRLCAGCKPWPAAEDAVRHAQQGHGLEVEA